MLPAIISAASLGVISVASIALYTKTSEVQNDFNTKLRNIVDQVNTTQYYDYEIDKKQQEKLAGLHNNTEDIRKNYISKGELNQNVTTQKLDVNNIKQTNGSVDLSGNMRFNSSLEGASVNPDYIIQRGGTNDIKNRLIINAPNESGAGIDLSSSGGVSRLSVNTDTGLVNIAKNLNVSGTTNPNGGNYGTVNTNEINVSNNLNVAGTTNPNGAKYGPINTNSVATNKLNLGDKWQLSGVGDKDGNDGWLRFFNKDGSDYYGGIATANTWTRDNSYMNQAYVNNLTVSGITNPNGAKYGPINTDEINVSKNLNVAGTTNPNGANYGPINTNSITTNAINTNNNKTNKLNLGDKWQLSGVGDKDGNDSWLRFFNKDGSDYYGGIATANTWTRDNSYMNNSYTNQAQVNTLTSIGQGDNNWINVQRNDGNLKIGADGTNRGIWSEGDRDTSIYTKGTPKLTVKADGSVNVPGTINAGAITTQVWGSPANNYISTDIKDGTNWFTIQRNDGNLKLGTDGKSVRGIYNDGDKNFGIYTDAKPRFSVTKNGNIGINNETPKTALDIKGDFNNTGKVETDWLHSRGDGVIDGNFVVNGLATYHQNPAGHTISSVGRQHIAPNEELYLLPRGQTHISKAWGGTGNLYVEGDTQIDGKLNAKDLNINGSGVASQTWVNANSTPQWNNIQGKPNLLGDNIDTWNTSTDGKNRFYFANNARTYFGSQNGYEWRNKADQNIATLENNGDIYVHGNAQIDGKLNATDLNINGSGVASQTWVNANSTPQWNNIQGKPNLLGDNVDTWNTSTDGKNRFYFGKNDRSYFGSQNGYEWRNKADQNIAALSDNGDFTAPQVGRPGGATDWFRINGNNGNNKNQPGTALYNGLAINDGGGLDVGQWNKQPQGQLHADYIHSRGDAQIDGKFKAGPDGQSVNLGTSEIKLRGDGKAHYSIFNTNGVFSINNTGATSTMGTAGTPLATLDLAGNFNAVNKSEANWLHSRGDAQVDGNTTVNGTLITKNGNVFNHSTGDIYGLGSTVVIQPPSKLAHNNSGVYNNEASLKFNYNNNKDWNAISVMNDGVQTARIDATGNANFAGDISAGKNICIAGTCLTPTDFASVKTTETSGATQGWVQTWVNNSSTPQWNNIQGKPKLLGDNVNIWNTSTDGKNRFYFANNDRTYFGSQNGYEWRNKADQNIAALEDTGNANFAGKISAFEIGRPANSTEWFRINQDNGNNPKQPGTALYNGLSINDGGGLDVGQWVKQPQGQIHADYIHSRGDAQIDGKFKAGPDGQSVNLGTSEIKFRGDGKAHYSIFNTNGVFSINDTGASSTMGTNGKPLATLDLAGNFNTVNKSEANWLHSRGDAQIDGKLNVNGPLNTNINPIYLKGANDTNHLLAHSGYLKNFAGTGKDGPILTGYTGGVLGSRNNVDNWALQWDNSGNVGINNSLTTNNINTFNHSAGDIYGLGSTVVIQPPSKLGHNTASPYSNEASLKFNYNNNNGWNAISVMNDGVQTAKIDATGNANFAGKLNVKDLNINGSGVASQTWVNASSTPQWNNIQGKPNLLGDNVDTWNTSTDGKNRFYFANNARTYFGSQNGYEWRNKADQNIATLENNGDANFAGKISAFEIGRPVGATDWFRINGNNGGNPKQPGTALYNGLAINDGGGLDVGQWNKQPQGQIHADYIHSRGDAQIDGKINVNGTLSMGAPLNTNIQPIHLRGANDANHILSHQYYFKDTNSSVFSTGPDGPLLTGYAGGTLGTRANYGNDKWALRWDNAGNVNVNGSLKVNGPTYIANKWQLGETNREDPTDDWLRLYWPGGYGLNDALYRGGFAAGKLWSAGGIVQGSDSRMKDNIKRVSQNDINNLNRLNPTTYNYKDNSDQRYGFIAQEVEKIYPDMVKDGPNGMKSLRYDDIIPLAVGNIQNLNKQVQPDRLCIGNTCVSEQELKQLKFLLSQN